MNVGEQLTPDILNQEYSDFGVMEYTSNCEHVEFVVILNFNDTLYSTPSDAWDSDELYVFTGIHFDQTQTTFNVWEIIGMLLFFGLPDVHFLINAVISIPLWCCIAYLSYILILRTIGALFGGGA